MKAIASALRKLADLIDSPKTTTPLSSELFVGAGARCLSVEDAAKLRPRPALAPQSDAVPGFISSQRSVPKRGDSCYYVNPLNLGVDAFLWSGTRTERKLLYEGLLYASRDDALGALAAFHGGTETLP